MPQNVISEQQLVARSHSNSEAKLRAESRLRGRISAVNDAEALCRAREVIGFASRKSAMISASLAVRPGPSSSATVIPEIAAIWRVQAQMVTEIGNVFGKNGKLTEDSVVSCLLKHAGAQFVREFVNQIAESLRDRRDANETSEAFQQKIGTEITDRVERNGSFGWLCLLGAIAVAAYAYFDTDRMGQTAIDFFRKEMDLR